MAGGELTNGGRVTQRDLYEALLEQNKDRADMERRILEKLEPIPRIENQVNTNKDEIEKLRAKSTRDDWIGGVSAAITGAGVAIATILGIRQ